MKKRIILSIKDRKLLRKPGVKKWLRGTEKALNKMITPRVIGHIALGYPIKVCDDHIECSEPFAGFDIKNKDIKAAKLSKDIFDPSPYFKLFARKK